MNQEEVVLCGSSAYTKKYYLNPDFQKLPQGIQDELKLMCVLYTEDVGGTLTLKFDEDGELIFETAAMLDRIIRFRFFKEPTTMIPRATRMPMILITSFIL